MTKGEYKNESLVRIVRFFSFGCFWSSFTFLIEVEVIFHPLIEATLRAAFIDRTAVLRLAEGVDAD